MSIGTMMLIINLIAKGVGVCQEIKDLAVRCQAGEEITAEEIEAAGDELDSAVEDFLKDDFPSKVLARTVHKDKVYLKPIFRALALVTGSSYALIVGLIKDLPEGAVLDFIDTGRIRVGGFDLTSEYLEVVSP